MTAEDKEKVIESLSQRREINEAAKALIADKAFGHCWMAMRQELFAQLMAEKRAGPGQDEICAKLRAQEELFARLGKLIENYHAEQRMSRHA